MHGPVSKRGHGRLDYHLSMKSMTKNHFPIRSEGEKRRLAYAVHRLKDVHFNHYDDIADRLGRPPKRESDIETSLVSCHPPRFEVVDVNIR